MTNKIKESPKMYYKNRNSMIVTQKIGTQINQKHNPCVEMKDMHMLLIDYIVSIFPGQVGQKVNSNS